MRLVDPFDYFPHHASAVSGFGGAHLSPDPRYCFHTSYGAIRPGPAVFELRLRAARWTFGELSLRVHAYRPDSGEDACLVTGDRLDPVDEQVQDMTARVRFAARRGVTYAFHGYFPEGSDLRAEDIEIALVECEEGDDTYIEPPQSLLAGSVGPKEVRPANALIHVVTPRVSAPVSQDCTRSQLEEITGSTGDWAETLTLTALDTYGVERWALETLLIGPASAECERALEQRGLPLQRLDAHDVPPSDSLLFADIVLWPSGLWGEPDPDRRWAIVQGWVGRLKIGGLGIMTARYRPDRGPVSSDDIGNGPDITRNEIGKWALRLIGDGYSVAPLAFSAPEELDLDQDGLARFALIVRRL